MKKKLSPVKEGREVLCKSCETKYYQTIISYPRKEYGEIVVHNKGCSKIKEVLKEGLGV